MADYFTNLSLILKLPTKAAQTYALDLAHQAREVLFGGELDNPPAGFPASLAEVVEDWNFVTETSSSTDGYALWLHSSNGDVDAACAFIQHLLQKFDPKGSVSFEWSNDCSKPRVDAYGGGAAIVTARSIKTMSTGHWLQKHAARCAQLSTLNHE